METSLNITVDKEKVSTEEAVRALTDKIKKFNQISVFGRKYKILDIVIVNAKKLTQDDKSSWDCLRRYAYNPWIIIGIDEKDTNALVYSAVPIVLDNFDGSIDAHWFKEEHFIPATELAKAIYG